MSASGWNESGAALSLRLTALSTCSRCISCSGSCSVALNRDHYKSLLLSHIPPLPAHKASAKQKQARKWIHMGFPEQRYETYPSLCSWSVAAPGTEGRETGRRGREAC